MSISMERFASEGKWRGGRDLTVGAPHRPAPGVDRECHYCGFAAPARCELPQRCPKYGGSAWERRTRTADRFDVAEERATVTRDIGRALAALARTEHSRPMASHAASCRWH